VPKLSANQGVKSGVPLDVQRVFDSALDDREYKFWTGAVPVYPASMSALTDTRSIWELNANLWCSAPAGVPKV
jgi:hypothetical protein